MGVTEKYRNCFELICNDLELNLRYDYIDFEINSLKRLVEQIQVNLKFLFLFLLNFFLENKQRNTSKRKNNFITL